jgi:hypothetical protein
MDHGVAPRLKGEDEEREIWDRERGCRCGSNLPPCGADVTAGDRGGVNPPQNMRAPEQAEPYPPLSALQTSPPQGGRPACAKNAPFACIKPGPRASGANDIPALPCNLFPTLYLPCHHCRTPVTGWIVNVPVQAGGRPPGACRNVRRDDGGGGASAGSAGSRITTQGDRPSQPPDKSSPLVSGQRRPAIRVRVETGLWRAALRMRGGHGVKTPWPWRSRIVNARPSPCRTMPPAADRCPCPGGRTRHATACRMWTSSGEARAAREPRHRLLIFSEGKARGRPSGIQA